MKSIDLRNLTPKQYELIAAMAVKALCEIANYQDPEKLREDEEQDEPQDDDDVIISAQSGYGLDPDEVIEMAYENVLSTARGAIDRIAEHAKPAAAEDIKR